MQQPPGLRLIWCKAWCIETEFNQNAVGIGVVHRMAPAMIRLHDRQNILRRHGRFYAIIAGLVGAEGHVVDPHRQAQVRRDCSGIIFWFADTMEVEKSQAGTIPQVKKMCRIKFSPLP